MISWASIDYCGRWKALHYAAKRFFRPLTLSCAEEGLLTQNPNINFERYEYEENALKKRACACAWRTRPCFPTVEVTWQLRRAHASVISQGRETVTVEPLSSKWLEYEDFADADTFGDYIAYQMTENGAPPLRHRAVLRTEALPLCRPAARLARRGGMRSSSLPLPTPAACRSSMRTIHSSFPITSSDMNAGETRVRILSGQPFGLRVRSVYDIR